MEKIKWFAAGILLLACTASAQQTPPVEVSAGYSYFRLGGSGGFNQHGGTVSVAGNLNNWFGIVGDFGAYHNSSFGASFNTYTFMFGPRFSLRAGRVTPFVQTLVGGAHLRASGFGASSAITPFAASVGGGVDLHLSRNVALRPEVDYIAMRSHGSTQNAGRASLDLVFRFGGR